MGHDLVAVLKDLFASGAIGPDGVVCFMESRCRRGFMPVRLGFRKSEGGYSWTFELLPNRDRGAGNLLRQGEEDTEEAAWVTLAKTVGLSQRYLDEAVACGIKTDGTVN